MAFPVVENSALTNGTTAASSMVVDLPTGITAGETLLVLVRQAGAGPFNDVSGWTEMFDDASDGSNDNTAMYWRKADGAEGASITIVSAGSTSKFAAIALRISGATDPTVRAPEFPTLATGSSTTPNPGSLSPTGGAKDYLWLWCGGWEGEQTSPPTGNPTNYSSPLGADSGTAGAVTTNCRVATAQRTNNAASEDPGSWTISATDDWTATVIAVHPAGAGPQTVSPGLIDQSGVLFGPLVNQQIQGALIDQSGTVFSPQVNLQVAPGLIDQSGVLFSPQVNQQVQAGLVDQSGVTFAPTVTSTSPQTVSPGLIDQSGVTFAPQVNQQALPGLIDQSGVLFNPQINQQVQGALIDQSGVTFAPVITIPGPQTVVPGLIDQSGVTFAPVITIPTPQTVSPGLIDQSGVTFAPQINLALTPGLIDNAGVVFNPAISQQVQAQVIDNAGVLFSPVVTLEGQGVVAPALINQSGVVFAPYVLPHGPRPLVLAIGQPSVKWRTGQPDAKWRTGQPRTA